MYGNCSTDFTVKTKKGNVATEISIERNLGKCDHFQPISTGVSPLALIRGMVSFTSALLCTLAAASSLLTLWNVRARRDPREKIPGRENIRSSRNRCEVFVCGRTGSHVRCMHAC